MKNKDTSKALGFRHGDQTKPGDAMPLGRFKMGGSPAKNIKQNIKMGNNQQSSQDPAANQDQPVQNQEPAADQPTVDQQPPVAAEVPPPVIDPVISEDPAPSPPVESPTPAEIASLPPEGEQVSIETLADETEKPWTEVTDIALLRNIQQNFVSSTEEHDAISDRIRELNTKSAE